MIRNWQYLHEYETNRKEMLEIVDRVFSSGRLILGEEVSTFEKNFSAYCGVKYGVGVNSGTDALFLALKAIGIKDGDEVITVANTAVPTIAAICAAGARPVFADVEEDSFLIDITKITSVFSKRTKCILPVHLFGQAVDMGPLLEIAAEKDLKVIEDCAQAAGALYKGKAVGSFGNIGAFSFYPTKILGAYGDGGMAVTGREAYFRKLRRLRYYGMEESYYSLEEGYNSRLDEIQAALLNYKLKTLNEAVQKRQEIARLYSAGLNGVGDIYAPVIKDDRSHQFYAYTIRTRYRDKLMRHLNDQGIESRINYPSPIHLMKGYNYLGYKKGDLPVTEGLSKRILSLPVFPGLTMNDIDKVIDRIRHFFKKA